jgi:phosphate transport system protein
MPRETFDRDLNKLKDDILVFGSMVEQAILESMDGLRHRDLLAARRIIKHDLVLNQKRFEIENNCLVQIATQQPMARDLRVLAAILEINTELERIGDYAKGISRINLLLGDTNLIIPISDLDAMAERGLDMLHRSLSAFTSLDVVVARAIPQEDDEIDALYNQIYRELMIKMLANPILIDHANYLIWAAHNLERLGDRVTNICERIVFAATGEMQEFDVSDADNEVPMNQWL